MRSKNVGNYLDKYEEIEKICKEINIKSLHLNTASKDVRFSEDQMNELSKIIVSMKQKQLHTINSE